MYKIFAILPLILLATISLSGCGNTFHGAGLDLEEWGKTLQDTF